MRSPSGHASVVGNGGGCCAGRLLFIVNGCFEAADTFYDSLRKAGSGGAAIEAERRFAEETNLARQDCLGPSWARGMFFVLAEVLV